MTHLHGTLTSLRVVTVTSFHGQIVVLNRQIVLQCNQNFSWDYKP